MRRPFTVCVVDVERRPGTVLDPQRPGQPAWRIRFHLDPAPRREWRGVLRRELLAAGGRWDPQHYTLVRLGRWRSRTRAGRLNGGALSGLRRRLRHALEKLLPEQWAIDVICPGCEEGAESARENVALLVTAVNERLLQHR